MEPPLLARIAGGVRGRDHQAGGSADPLQDLAGSEAAGATRCIFGGLGGVFLLGLLAGATGMTGFRISEIP